MLAATVLFDGVSLSGWQVEGKDLWRVQEAMIIAEGDGDSYLISQSRFGDFSLSLEFLADAGVNSGVFIRCQVKTRIHPTSCYELNIWDQHPRQDARTGAIVFKAMPPLAQVDTIGRWSRLEVTARGSGIELRINGVVTARLSDADTAPGWIALQHFEKGKVAFRNIVLTPLED